MKELTSSKTNNNCTFQCEQKWSISSVVLHTDTSKVFGLQSALCNESKATGLDDIPRLLIHLLLFVNSKGVFIQVKKHCH